MGKWDGKRQAARRASRPQGAASAVADRRVRPEAEPPCGPVPAFCANFGQGSRPGSLPGKGLGKVDAGGQAKRGRAAAPGKSNAKWRACSLLGLGLLQGGGARRALRLRRSRRQSRRGRPQDGLPFGRPGRAEIQRKYRVTSAPGPADGRWLHGFAAPVRGKYGCGGWPQQNPPGVRQIQAHPRRQSAPARPR